MFAYCGNNPVNMVDFSGEMAIEIALLYEVVYYIGTFALSYLATKILVTLPELFSYPEVQTFPNNTYEKKPVTQQAKSKGKENMRDSGLANETDAEIQAKARDKSLSPNERKRYQKEEKARGLRNRAKRQEFNRKLTTK